MLNDKEFDYANFPKYYRTRNHWRLFADQFPPNAYCAMEEYSKQEDYYWHVSCGWWLAWCLNTFTLFYYWHNISPPISTLLGWALCILPFVAVWTWGTSQKYSNAKASLYLEYVGSKPEPESKYNLTRHDAYKALTDIAKTYQEREK